MCSHVEIITYLLHSVLLRLDHYVFLFGPLTLLYYANAYCNRFSPIVQVLLVHRHHILRCGQRLVSWENETEIARAAFTFAELSFVGGNDFLIHGV